MTFLKSLSVKSASWLAALYSRLPPPLKDQRVRLRFQAGIAIALSAGLMVYLLLLAGWLGGLDTVGTDFMYHPVPGSDQIVIVAIDQKSIDELGPLPWSRALYAALIKRLSASPPRAIAFDLVFAQPTPDDPLFASAIQESGNVLLAAAPVHAAAFPPQSEHLPSFDVIILPETALREAARETGHRMIVPDADQIVRRVPTGVEANNLRYAALGLSAAAQFLDSPIQFDLSRRAVMVGSTHIPVDEFGNTLLNFSSPTRGFRTVSFVDVIRGIVPPTTFSDKLVFVGTLGASQAESYAIPLQLGEAQVTAVQLQANLSNMLLSIPPLTLQNQGALGQLAVILVVALLAGLTLPHIRPLYAAAVTIVYLLGLLLYAFEMFNRGIIVHVVYPTIALLLTFGLVTTFRYLSEERRRQFLTALFRRYVPPESLGRIVDAIDRGELPLSGTRRMVTVLYADFRGFATLSEGLAPEALLDLVNRYIELTLHPIQSRGGTVSKPMGDSLVAIWNAPLDQPDHTTRALLSAVEIRRNINRFQESRSEDERLNFGIGLATGWAVLGNISALGKTEYTLVGDTVNIAARISAFANNNQILSDAATAANPPPGIETRELSPVRIRGRKEPLPIWEIQDHTEPD